MKSIVDCVERLHSPPQVAASLLSLTTDEDYDPQAVTECIESDPALTLQLMRIVNSSRYGLPKHITNLGQAVTVVGRRTLRLTVLTFSIVDTFTRGISKGLYDSYWRRALTVAHAASKLARNFPTIDPNDVYTAGLLSDLGVLLLAQSMEDYSSLHNRYRHGPELIQAERDRYGFDHAQLGACLLEKWEFPDSLIHAVGVHHADEGHGELSSVVRGGSIVAEILWDDASRESKAATSWLEESQGLDVDALIDLALSCKDDVLMELEIYGVDLNREIDFAALAEEARRRFLDASMQTALEMDSLCAVVDDCSVATHGTHSE